MIEMSKKTNKNVEEKKVKINKGQLGVRIMAAFLAFLMLLSAILKLTPVISLSVLFN